VDPQQGAGNPITAAYPLPRKIEEEKNAAATPPKERRQKNSAACAAGRRSTESHHSRRKSDQRGTGIKRITLTPRFCAGT